MKNLRRLQIAALALGLFIATVSPGCGSVAADIMAARTAIGIISMAITAVQDFANAYFTEHPDAAKSAALQRRIAEAEAAAAAGEALINGGAAVNAGDVAQAFGDFEAAYQDVVALAKDLGIVPAPLGSRVGVEKIAGRLVVPSAADLIPKGVDMAKVSARVQAVRAARAGQAGSAEAACRGAIMNYGADGRIAACDVDGVCVPLTVCASFSLRSPGHPAGSPSPVAARASGPLMTTGRLL